MAVPAVGPSVRAMLLGVAPISVLSVRGKLLGQSQRMPYLVSQGDTFRVAKSSNKSGRQNGDGHGRSRRPATTSAQQAPKTGDWYRPTSKQASKQNVAQTYQVNRKPRHHASSRGIAGTTVERTKMKPSLTQVAASLIAASCAVTPARAGMAPKNAPDLPENFCPKATGVATATTGECMCNWQDERGCTGSGCKYEMGLSWYHYTCEDCECVPEPKKQRKKKR